MVLLIRAGFLFIALLRVSAAPLTHTFALASWEATTERLLVI